MWRRVLLEMVRVADHSKLFQVSVEPFCLLYYNSLTALELLAETVRSCLLYIGNDQLCLYD